MASLLPIDHGTVILAGLGGSQRRIRATVLSSHGAEEDLYRTCSDCNTRLHHSKGKPGNSGWDAGWYCHVCWHAWDKVHKDDDWHHAYPQQEASALQHAAVSKVQEAKAEAELNSRGVASQADLERRQASAEHPSQPPLQRAAGSSSGSIRSSSRSRTSSIDSSSSSAARAESAPGEEAAALSPPADEMLDVAHVTLGGLLDSLRRMDKADCEMAVKYVDKVLKNVAAKSSAEGMDERTPSALESKPAEEHLEEYELPLLEAGSSSTSSTTTNAAASAQADLGEEATAPQAMAEFPSQPSSSSSANPAASVQAGHGEEATALQAMAESRSQASPLCKAAPSQPATAPALQPAVFPGPMPQPPSQPSSPCNAGSSNTTASRSTTASSSTSPAACGQAAPGEETTALPSQLGQAGSSSTTASIITTASSSTSPAACGQAALGQETTALPSQPCKAGSSITTTSSSSTSAAACAQAAHGAEAFRTECPSRNALRSKEEPAACKQHDSEQTAREAVSRKKPDPEKAKRQAQRTGSAIRRIPPRVFAPWKETKDSRKWHRGSVVHQVGSSTCCVKWDHFEGRSIVPVSDLRDAHGCLLSGPQPDESRTVINIACLGDSMTFGGYPVHLRDGLDELVKTGRLPSYHFQVLDFGWCATTASKQNEDYYGHSPPFREALQLGSQIDIAIFMLGTNDSKTYVWNEQRFEDEFAALIKQVQGWSTQKRPLEVLLVAPPPMQYDGVFDMQRRVVNNLLPGILFRLATRLQVQFVNASLQMMKVLGKPPFFSEDGVHLSESGDRLLANIIQLDLLKLLDNRPKQLVAHVAELC